MDGSEEAKANFNLPGWVVSRDSAPGVIFAHASGKFYRVEDTFWAVYQGNQIPVGQLRLGSVATVTVGFGNTVTRIEVTSLSEQRAANMSVTVSVQPSLAGNQTCDICRINQATYLCNCKIPPALLCNHQCFLNHQGKNTLLPHSILPLSALTDQEGYMGKFNDLKQGRAELMRNVELIDKFEQEVITAVDNAMETLRNYKSAWIRKVSSERKTLLSTAEEAIREAEYCLAKGTACTNPLADALLSLPAEKLRLITYSVNLPDFQTSSQEWVTFRNELGNISDLLTKYRNPLVLNRCKKCNQTYADDYFPQFPICGCRFCAVCQAGMLQSGNQVCLCGTYFAQHSTDIVNSMNYKCIACGNTDKLMTEFTSVRCSDHIVCLKCLDRVMGDPEPSCPVDHRRFAQDEIEAANRMLDRQCGLYCGRYFPSSEALPLDCGCHYCEKCALKEVKRSSQHSYPNKCFICSSPVPKAVLDRYDNVINQLGLIKHFVRGLGYYQAPKCEICLAAFGRKQNITLACNHPFHKECLADQAEFHTDAIVKHEIECMKCHARIDGNILQRVMKPQLFHKYCVQLIEAQNSLVHCPNCHTGHTADRLMLQQQAPVGCQNCGFLFCALCEGQWSATHDITPCKFDDKQKQIAELEQVMGPNDTISQCPTCKETYCKEVDDGYIRCNTPGCPDWNFCCSSLRQPCLSHSLHWHRPDCRYAGTEDISGYPMRKDCPECVKLGRRCDPPRRLKVPRRFDLDEY